MSQQQKYPTGAECAWCGEAINYGDPVTMMNIGVASYDGTRFVIAPLPKFEFGALVHSDCATKFSHAEITKDDCEAPDPEEMPCAYCESRLQGVSG